MTTLLPGLLLGLAVLNSCDMPECENHNPVFAQYNPEDEPYKAELARQIERRGQENLRYWVDRYFVEDSTKYLGIFVQGDSLCAKGILEIREPGRLEHLIKVNGGGYSGAGLSGLRMKIERDGGSTNFVFKEVRRIID